LAGFPAEAQEAAAEYSFFKGTEAMQEVNFLTKYQKTTKRDYVARVVEHDKAECATTAKKCGKAFLLYELTKAVSGLTAAGIDISEYGIEHAKEEMKPFLKVGSCTKLPFPDKSFDFVYSINTFHNLKIDEVQQALQEVERVGRGKKWVCVESYRNEREKANLLYWQLTCMSFHTTDEWAWLYKHFGYTGDYGFIFFE
jgi:ubiquinone/menaquinone biosynthesis C-methylase UbiE